MEQAGLRLLLGEILPGHEFGDEALLQLIDNGWFTKQTLSAATKADLVPPLKPGQAAGLIKYFQQGRLRATCKMHVFIAAALSGPHKPVPVPLAPSLLCFFMRRGLSMRAPLGLLVYMGLASSLLLIH